MKISLSLRESSLVALALLLTACSQVLDLDSYSERPGSGGSGGNAETCPQGNCTWSCAKGQTCDTDCSGGNCTLACASGATCNSSCSGGNCVLNCSAGATCDATCSGGGCTFECPSGAACSTTCTGEGCHTTP